MSAAPDRGREAPDLEIPAIRELAGRRQWVCWRFEERDGKRTKVPIMTSGRRASSTDPATWATYSDAEAAYQRGLGDGVGYVFAQDDPYFGLDLDGCVNGSGPEPWARDAVAALATYTELSPSGAGLHAIGRGTLPPGRRRNGKAEVYDRGRFFCMTGWILGTSPPEIRECPDLQNVYRRLFGQAEEKKAESSESNAKKFRVVRRICG